MNTTTAKKCRRLRRREASEYLKEEWGILRKPSTLAKLASVGGGPAIEYDGTIPLYCEEALDQWATETLSPPVRSTTELKTLRDRKQI